MRIADPLVASTPLSSERSASTSSAAPAATTNDAKVSISSTAQRLSATAAVDSSKVRALKGALAAGTFRVDPLGVAQAMLSGA